MVMKMMKIMSDYWSVEPTQPEMLPGLAADKVRAEIIP